MSSSEQFQAIRAVVSDELTRVDQFILKSLAEELELINDLGTHVFASGGKRIRPLLVCLIAKALNYSGEQHIPLAALIEYLHTATLIHDDVVDNSKLRRGHDTANAIWDNKASVLVGDFLFSRSFQLMVSLDHVPIMGVISDVTNSLARGEVLQLMNRNNADVDENYYFEVIDAKTATLFAAASQTAAMLASHDDALQTAMRHYGIYVGRAFQLVDDALDYHGDTEQLGKNIGDDLADGKATMPVIYALNQLSDPNTKQALRQAIEQGNPDALGTLQQAIASTQAIEYTYSLAKECVQQALACLTHLPNTPYRNALSDLANFTINRQF